MRIITGKAKGIKLLTLEGDATRPTSERAKEKVLQLAQEMCEFCAKIHVHVISLTHIQEEIRDKCEEDYFTLLLRRFMMKLATRVAKEKYCNALITGESLGQVASQTMKAIHVVNEMADIPLGCENVIKSTATQLWDPQNPDRRLDNGTCDIDTADAEEYAWERFIKW